MVKDQDDKHTKGRACHNALAEAMDKKLRDELAQLLGASDAKHKEIRTMLPQQLESLDTRLREEMREVTKTLLEMCEQHQAAIDRNNQGETQLRQELSQLAKENDGRNAMWFLAAFFFFL